MDREQRLHSTMISDYVIGGLSLEKIENKHGLDKGQASLMLRDYQITGKLNANATSNFQGGNYRGKYSRYCYNLGYSLGNTSSVQVTPDLIDMFVSERNNDQTLEDFIDDAVNNYVDNYIDGDVDPAECKTGLEVTNGLIQKYNDGTLYGVSPFRKFLGAAKKSLQEVNDDLESESYKSNSRGYKNNDRGYRSIEDYRDNRPSRSDDDDGNIVTGILGLIILAVIAYVGYRLFKGVMSINFERLGNDIMEFIWKLGVAVAPLVAIVFAFIHKFWRNIGGTIFALIVYGVAWSASISGVEYSRIIAFIAFLGVIGILNSLDAPVENTSNRGRGRRRR